MGGDNIWSGDPLAQYSVSDQRHGQGRPMMRTSLVGVACFALAGMAITAILVGKDVPQTGMEAYFVNDQLVTAGRHSLDLSRPIFVRGNVPICPSEDALAGYSSGDTEGCTVLHDDAPAGLIGIVTDGMRQPTFQMQMKTPDGTIRGWVEYNNLTN
jgi:hypothetical protein